MARTRFFRSLDLLHRRSFRAAPLIAGYTAKCSAEPETGRRWPRHPRFDAQELGCDPIALSLVIVFAAGLLTRTLQKFAAVDLGFQPDRVIALNVDPTASGHSNAEVSTILDELLNRARDLPGMRATIAVR
jgi:hypothetical protein